MDDTDHAALIALGGMCWVQKQLVQTLADGPAGIRLGKGSDSKHRGPITVSGIVNITQEFSVKVGASRKCSTPFGPSRLAAKPLGANPLDHDLRY